MSEALKLGLDTAILAAYSDIPRLSAPVPDIGQGLWYIRDGAEVWPGNGEPITDEVRRNYLAGNVVQFLSRIVLNPGGDEREQHPDLHNPYLEEAIATIDGLVPGRSQESDEFADKLYHHWLRAFDQNEDEDLSSFTVAADSVAGLVRVEVPELTEGLEAKIRLGGQLYLARGTVQKEAFNMEEVFSGMEDIDLSEIPPSRIEVQDGELVEPAVWDVIDLVNKTGAKSFMYDFPYYSTWREENGVEILRCLLEDLARLQGAA